jgi:hypothetical protein
MHILNLSENKSFLCRHSIFLKTPVATLILIRLQGVEISGIDFTMDAPVPEAVMPDPVPEAERNRM